MARLVLAGGPFDGHEAAALPPDRPAPAQIVWDGWLYEWRGETSTLGGYTDALIYRSTGRRLTPDEMPPLIAEAVDMWADGAMMIAHVCDVPKELLWPGL